MSPNSSIQTRHGTVTLVTPAPELLRQVRQFLPFGAVRFLPPQENADFGIVMQCGEREVWAVKQQPPDTPKEWQGDCWGSTGMLIAKAIRQYLSSGIAGLLMPCAYIREKGGDRQEIGFAYFGQPCPNGAEALEHPFEGAWDHQHGHGFTTMLTHFIRALQQASRDTGLTLQGCIGLDHRPRLALGRLGFGFAIIGRHVLCLKTRIGPAEPVWDILGEDGITEVVHIPSIPLAIEEKDLPTAKPPPEG